MIDAPRPGKITSAWVASRLRQRLDRVLSPAVGPSVLRELGRAEANFRTVADLLQGDPYLTGRLIAVAELTRDNRDEPLRDVEDAVRLLGLKQVESLLLSVMLIGPLASDVVVVHAREDVWAWSLGCGIAADLIVRESRPGPGDTPLPDHAGLVDGLMLGLGSLILLAGVGWTYSQTLGPQVRPTTLADDERADFGVSHHQVTAWALDAMGCPSMLAGSSAALIDPGAWDTAAARFAHAIELYSAKLAGFSQNAIDEYLNAQLPAFGCDYPALQRDTLDEGRRRLKAMMDAFNPSEDEGTDRRSLTRQSGDALAGHVESDARRRSA